jgi:hypothetical protein
VFGCINAASWGDNLRRFECHSKRGGGTDWPIRIVSAPSPSHFRLSQIPLTWHSGTEVVTSGFDPYFILISTGFPLYPLFIILVSVLHPDFASYFILDSNRVSFISCFHYLPVWLFQCNTLLCLPFYSDSTGFPISPYPLWLYQCRSLALSPFSVWFLQGFLL